VVDFLSNNVAAITLVLAAICLLTIVLLEALHVGRLTERIDQLTGGVEGGDLEAVLGEHLETVHAVGRDLDELTARVAFIESSARHHFSKEGLVRFNPFPDTGGNQSFALALLDESDDGVVVSSLHSRTGTRIYAKAVVAGKADTSLSAEEQDAIDEARSKRSVRPATVPRSAAASRIDPVAGTGPAYAPPAGPTPARPGSAAGASAKAAVAAPSQAVGSAAPGAVASTRARPVIQDDDTAYRPASGRAKGQEKPRDVPAPEVSSEADSERVHRKPGQPPASGPGQR
jgi:hypothetical protein